MLGCVLAAAAEDQQTAPAAEHTQRNQPPGVPPLALTGERTLPDVPAENYWYQRHLVVYEWIAEQCVELDIVDMACGEGYGSEVLARRGKSVVGVDANPEAHEHAVARYTRPGLSFERDLIETFRRECDAVVFLQTIEHVQDAAAVLRNMKQTVGSNGVVFVSTPNVLTLAPEGADRSGNPWHVYEYRPDEFRALCESVFDSVEIHGLFHARKLAIHEFAIRKLAWDSIHPKLRITKPFYDRFTPAISVRDFRLVRDEHRPGRLDGALDLIAVLR